MAEQTDGDGRVAIWNMTRPCYWPGAGPGSN